MRSHRHLDQVGPLTSIRSRSVLLAAALVVSSGSAQDDPRAARSKGAPNAPVTVYEMADFQCPACRMFTVTVLPTLDREFVQTGKVRWVFINLPLTSIHPNAVAAAEVAMCAARQGRFWDMHDALYQRQPAWSELAAPGPYLLAVADTLGLDHAALARCVGTGATRAAIQRDAHQARRIGALGRRRAAGQAGAGVAAGRPPRLAARVHVLLAVGGAAGAHAAGRRDRLPADRPTPGGAGGARSAAAGGAGLQQARRVARADARRGAAGRTARPHLGDGGAAFVTAAVAGAGVGAFRLS